MACIEKIVKRDGTMVPFDSNKIRVAIEKALTATNIQHVSSEVITSNVIERLPSFPTVEQCQDIVEEELMKAGLTKTAKAYILYRQKRNELRTTTITEAWRQECKKAVEYFPSVYNYIVYLRTYSKFLDEKGRRETWPQTVQRYIDFMRETLGEKLYEEEYKEIQEAILKMDVMPSMRLLQFAGEAVRRNNICSYNCAFVTTDKIEAFRDTLMILTSGAGVGFSVEKKYVNQLPVIVKQTGEVLPTHVIEDSREGWCESFYLGLKTWYSGKDITFDYSKIRPAGARLKTSGGRASGPDPLRNLLNFTRELILAKQGGQLSSINVHDLMCKIGVIVVCGGSRRSSEISLSDLDDVEIRDSKKGAFWKTHPDRGMANNSAVYDKVPSDEELLREWSALVASGTGERGIFNRSSLNIQLPSRRLEVVGDRYKHMGTNPCVAGFTWVMTVEGPKQVKDLIGKRVDLVVNGEVYPMESEGFFYTGDKEVYILETYTGYKLYLTADHPLMQHKDNKLVKTKLEELGEGDEVLLSNHRDYSEWNGPGTFSDGWLIGQLVGNGSISESTSINGNAKGYCKFWGESAKEMCELAFGYMKESCEFRSDVKVCHDEHDGSYMVGCVDLLRKAYSLGMSRKKNLHPALEKNSSNFYKGFLRGFFDADGTVIGSDVKGYSVRLSQSNLCRLRVVQRMLLRLGIVSKIYQNRWKSGIKLLPDGKGGKKEYYTKACHELAIGKDNIPIYHELIGFHKPDKLKKLDDVVYALRKRGFYRETFTDKIKSIELFGEISVYDVTVAKVHEFCANGIRVSNCGEQILLPNEFCNLTTIALRPHDNKTSILNKIRLATIIGTYQSSLDKFPVISPEWKENAILERLMGVSMTGQRDCKYLQDNLDLLNELRTMAVKTNEIYADRFGINRSTAITTTKPEGTSSEMLGVSNGVHARFAPYYIRRIRISATDPLAKLLIDQGVPYHPENGQTKETVNTWVFEFPQKSPEGSVMLSDLSALDQLNYWREVKVRYTEHNPSTTIHVKEGEWITVLNWLRENWSIVGGLSFLPYSDHIYTLAPYEAISKEEYEKKVREFPEIDFAKLILYEKSDTTERKTQWACVGDKCSLE